MPELPRLADPGRGSRDLGARDQGPGARDEPSFLAPDPQPLAAPLLLFDRVTKWYGPVIGVNQVTLELRPGITGLVGPNGAGKTTLIRLATGQVRPSIGRVTVCGLDAWGAAARRHVGYCPDDNAFYEDMTGRAFVYEMARLCGFSGGESRKRTGEVLDLVGMTAGAGRKLRGYSKGMRQRIKLAQALLHDPEVLILDEPLSGIDPVGRREMIALFRQLAGRGKCLLLSSHELEELEKLTEHVAFITRGRVAAVGTLAQVRQLLDDQPTAVRLDVEAPRQVANLLLDMGEVVGIEFRDGGVLIIHAKQPRQFFPKLGRLIVEEAIAVRRLEMLDASAQALLGYLMGGRRKS